MKKRLACLVLILLAFSSIALPLKDARALSLTTGVIVGDDIALRKTAAANGKLVARLDEGTVVKILETNVFSEWYRVETDTRSGYVNRMYVQYRPSLLPTSWTARNGVHCADSSTSAHAVAEGQKARQSE